MASQSRVRCAPVVGGEVEEDGGVGDVREEEREGEGDAELGGNSMEVNGICDMWRINCLKQNLISSCNAPEAKVGHGPLHINAYAVVHGLAKVLVGLNPATLFRLNRVPGSSGSGPSRRCGAGRPQSPGWPPSRFEHCEG